MISGKEGISSTTRKKEEQLNPIHFKVNLKKK
jgi:hypothetical protein